MIKNVVADLTTENNSEAEIIEERREHVQKESTLQPIINASSKLDINDELGRI